MVCLPADVAALFRQLRLWQIGVLLFLNAVVILATITGRWWVLAARPRHRVPSFPLFAYRLAAFRLSLFHARPRRRRNDSGLHGGARTRRPRSDALAAVILTRAIEFSINLTFLLLALPPSCNGALCHARPGNKPSAWRRAAARSVAYLAATALGLLSRNPLGADIGRRWPRFASTAVTIDESEAQVGRYFRQQPRAFGWAIAITLLGRAVLIAEYWFMIRFLGVSLTPPQLVGALTAARLHSDVFTGRFGALEAGQAAAFVLLGFDPPPSASAPRFSSAWCDTTLGLLGLWGGADIACLPPGKHHQPPITGS